MLCRSRLLCAEPVASAHPHVLVAAKMAAVFTTGGRIVAPRHVWEFDEMYSAFVSDGLAAGDKLASSTAARLPGGGQPAEGGRHAIDGLGIADPAREPLLGRFGKDGAAHGKALDQRRRCGDAESGGKL